MLAASLYDNVFLNLIPLLPFYCHFNATDYHFTTTKLWKLYIFQRKTWKRGKKLAFRPIFLYLCNQQEKFLPIPHRSSWLLWNHNSNLKTRWAYESSRFSKTLFRQQRKSQHMDLLLQSAMSTSPAMRTLSIRDL